MNKKKIKGGKNNSLLSHGLIINNIDKKLSKDIDKKLSKDIYKKISNIIIQNDKNNKKENISFNFTKINANKKNLDNIYIFYIIDKIFNNYNKTNKGILKSDNILYGGKNRRLIKGGAKIEGIKDDLIKYCSTITEKIRSNTDYTDDIDITKFKKGDSNTVIEKFGNLTTFINENSRSIKTKIDLSINPHYSLQTQQPDGDCTMISEYNYYEYNKDIAEAYQSSFLENMSNMNEFIKEQETYIKNLTIEQKRIIQDYANVSSFNFYNYYMTLLRDDNYKPSDIKTALYMWFNSENTASKTRKKRILDSFYAQINHFKKELLSDRNYNRWLENPRINDTCDRIIIRLDGNDWFNILNKFIEDVNNIIINAPMVKKIIYCYRGSTINYIEKNSIVNGEFDDSVADRDIFISKQISSFTFDFQIAEIFSNAKNDRNACIYRTAIMPFSRVLYVTPLSSSTNECEIISPSNTSFLFKANSDNKINPEIAYNNLNIKSGLCSTESFNSIDKILFLTKQPESFELNNIDDNITIVTNTIKQLDTTASVSDDDIASYFRIITEIYNNIYQYT